MIEGAFRVYGSEYITAGEFHKVVLESPGKRIAIRDTGSVKFFPIADQAPSLFASLAKPLLGDNEAA